jgi:hypothetical protein
LVRCPQHAQGLAESDPEAVRAATERTIGSLSVCSILFICPTNDQKGKLLHTQACVI